MPMTSNGNAPPWVLFIHDGRPSRILPAGRHGEGFDVSHLTTANAARIVKLGNDLYYELTKAKLMRVHGAIEALQSLFAYDEPTPTESTDK